MTLPPAAQKRKKRKMFGFPCSFVPGNMFMGLHQDSFILRLNPQDRASAIASGAATFALMGRTMKEYVQLPPAILADDAQLREWVERSYAFASAMPTKEKKPRANAKKTAPMDLEQVPHQVNLARKEDHRRSGGSA